MQHVSSTDNMQHDIRYGVNDGLCRVIQRALGFDCREPESLSEEVMDGLSYLAISCVHLQSTLWCRAL
jgi:hypothetical protein